MLPAHERFDAGDLGGPQVCFRLVVKDELPAVYSPPQLGDK